MPLCFSAMFGAEVNMINGDIWYMKEELEGDNVYTVFITHSFRKQGKQNAFFPLLF